MDSIPVQSQQGRDAGQSLPKDALSLEVIGGVAPEFQSILNEDAMKFVAKLQERFGQRRDVLLDQRRQVQQRLDAGWRPDFLPETQSIREADWTVAQVPEEIQDRRVEITGPVDRKMVINALNSGARVFMADFEDSHSPTWRGTLEGQINLYDAVRKTIEYQSPEGKVYRLGSNPAVLFVRPRGWHLVEKNIHMNGKLISASLFDFGLYFFHNAKELLGRKSGPYFYLPKIESHLEARLWNDVFIYAQQLLGIPQGSIRATVLIETILAAFEMDEILYELRDHSAGLNCGRWDYIFSFIKKFSNDPNFVLPDRVELTMDKGFLNAYCQLLVKTCHRRGIHAMGGMAAQIPIKGDPEANQVALSKVIADKQREVALGHDGTWVAHPGLVTPVMEVFDGALEGKNQITREVNSVSVTALDLLRVPAGKVTEAGLRTNLNIAIRYLEAWLRGAGCVPLNHLMEDAATAEISRAQVWQWLKHGKVTRSQVDQALVEEVSQIQSFVGSETFRQGKYQLAIQLLIEMITSAQFTEFLTIPAYRWI